MGNKDPLNTPVAFFFEKNGLSIVKIEFGDADPHSIYELKTKPRREKWGPCCFKTTHVD